LSFDFEVKGQAYGLAGNSDPVVAIGSAKKAAINLARVAALRRLCVVLLDGKCRWVEIMPMPVEIETSIVWNLPSPAPEKSVLPRMCTKVEDDTDLDGSTYEGILVALDRATGHPCAFNFCLDGELRHVDIASPSERKSMLRNIEGYLPTKSTK
jgi:hypothetical protein